MDEEEEFEPWVRRFRKADLLVLALSFATDVIAAVAVNLETATRLVAGHANFLNDRSDFHEQAALEIETLTNGDE